MGGEAAILEPATSGGGMESMRDLSSALWSLRTNQESARMLRTSLSLLRCFLFFDICYLIGGITLITMALSDQMQDKDNRMVFTGGVLTLFAFLFLHLAKVFYQHHFILKWEHLFLFLATYCLFSCWRHIHKQYVLMAFPRPEQVVVDVESVVRDYLTPTSSLPLPGDLPPKYEDVSGASQQPQTGDEEPPPQYDESMNQTQVLRVTVPDTHK